MYILKLVGLTMSLLEITNCLPISTQQLETPGNSLDASEAFHRSQFLSWANGRKRDTWERDGRSDQQRNE